MRTRHRKAKLLLWFAPFAFVLTLRSKAMAAEPKLEIDSTVQAVVKILTNLALKHNEAERRALAESYCGAVRF
ncbi:MAG: hypothetical protein ACM3SP_23475 [Chloroflexota bacterium]